MTLKAMISNINTQYLSPDTKKVLHNASQQQELQQSINEIAKKNPCQHFEGHCSVSFSNTKTNTTTIATQTMKQNSLASLNTVLV
jgi:hypothetical protein